MEKGSIASNTGVSASEMKRIARLVRLKITEEEAELYRAQLADVISWFGMLAEVNTAGVTPATNGGTPRALPLRDDMVEVEDIRDQVLSNAPEADMGFFIVKKVIE
ncbi:Asp-tRNA(Asn)/Glu-tRNA(Gln) amidotransferase subunit GatC [Candidatus Anaplasma sp. TIGMIC]|uniref:Asp-tRNA(Asn)/Glu-tRNA(Gln) amidotransferase subunit GatC n=1 Tax=Candidatus Anaplasma sp. TIGMIC TaxID=3020713 RepID=UPI00232E75E6|nr:Asp-tRNA(Asn)/Glu-tRNA(Gln) amidotransferase subunit GatC [Candidatus Anaplasma sp. TIGMIC]MDB1135537.1 Asp-tRNA(Asn)/Glu-tRNA(Gln) amidotransferase subunit GatC [Candidatus Anaplasma sp. TIGMIC]